MLVVNDNTPIIVGVGFAQITSDDPNACPEAIVMMENAIREAASNACSSAVLGELESIAVQKGSWKYSNPGKLLADALGCPQAKTILADLGVLQVMTFFELCEDIRAGRQQVGVVTGGESRYRELRSMISGVQVQDTVQHEDTPPSDVVYNIPDPFMSDLDNRCGVWAPGEYYALAESALRHHLGETLEQNRRRIAGMYSNFSHIAAQNPHAWSHDTFSIEDLLEINKKNGFIAYPYSKRLMSQWNVNQSVAIIVCSVTKARALGIPESLWVYPLASALNKKVTLLVQKSNLYTNPGTVLSGQRLFDAAGLQPFDVDFAELYSPFASAVECSKRDLQLPSSCPINISGSMAFAGGPFNHGGVDALARMVEVLRESPQYERKIGLINNLSGMFGKHGCCLLSNQSGEKSYSYIDVSDEVAEIEKPLPLNGDYTGQAKVIAYTVCFNKTDISHAIAYCDLPSGERTVARCNDVALCQQMLEQEFVGSYINISADGSFVFNLATAFVAS